MSRWTEADLATVTRQQQKPAKRSKFGNVKVELDGHVFDSKREAKFYQELMLRAKAGEVQAVAVHVPFPLVVNGVDCGRYEADFVFSERSGNNWQRVVADTKGVRTALYALKCKLMKAIHGIEIREVT